MILSMLKKEGTNIISSPLAKTSVLDLIDTVHSTMGPGRTIRFCAFMNS